MNNSTCKLQKGDDRIPVLQIARFRTKKANGNQSEIFIKKEGFKPESKLKIRLKYGRNILGKL